MKLTTQKELVTRLYTDPVFYIENFLFISTKDGTLTKLKLNKIQRQLVEYVVDCLEHKRPIRAIVLKARQEGVSTVVEAVIFWFTATRSHISSRIMAHDGKATDNLFAMFKRYNDNLHPALKPMMKYSNKKELQFSNPSVAKSQEDPGLGSKISVSTAGNKEAGRSETNQLMHGCLHKDSLVVMYDGYSKKIKDVEIGDKVFTSSGDIAPVSYKTMTGIKQTYKLNTWMSNEPIIASEDHKILTDSGYKKLKDISKFDYIAKPKYSFENKDYIEFYLPNIKRQQNGGTIHEEYRKIMLDEDFGYLVGYYLAEGHITSNLRRVTFTYNSKESFVRKCDKFFPNKPINKINGNKGITEYNSVFMANLLNDICGRVESKHVPLFGNKSFFTGILNGYLDGDGSKTDKQRIRATSIHERIARNISRIGNILGKHSSLHYNEPYRYDVKTKPTLTNSFHNGVPSKYKFIDGQCFVKVKSVDKFEISETYDLEINHKDHNFETPSGVVSNSEVAFWENPDEVMAGMLQTIPMSKNTMVFLESTANGVGGYFYEAYQKAKNGESGFKAFFFPWWEHEEYSIPAGRGFRCTDEEKELKETLNLTNDQINWRRLKKAELAGTKQKFEQEYPADDMEAFISSGRPRFDIETLKDMRKHLDKFEQGELDKRKFNKTDRGCLKVWERPFQGAQYVIGVDVAEGLEQGDNSVIQVIDRKTTRQVAEWCGKIDPDKLGEYVYYLGRWYNDGLVGVESNNHGLTTLTILKQMLYPNLYYRQILDDRKKKRTTKMGWHTNIKTKPLMIDEMSIWIRERLIKFNSKELIDECMTYIIEPNGATNAQTGCHDDRVTSMAIALQMYKLISTEKEDDPRIKFGESRSRR